MSSEFPDLIADETVLDEWLTRPRQVLIDFIRTVESPLVVLGAGGKMGPGLAVLAKRAAEAAGHPLEVIAASRFSDPAARAWLEDRGVRTEQADALRREDLARLPDTANLIYLIGIKFGTSSNPGLTWAINTLAPAAAMERWRGSRIVALSTGNVYPLAPVEKGGSHEDDPLTPPGEYAHAALARERIFDYFSREHGTPVALMRLSYALDLRYGVMADIARKVAAGTPISLATGHFNQIWQGDANEFILRALPLAESPATAWNLTSPRIHGVRETALRLGTELGKEPIFEGTESGTAFVSNTARLTEQLGLPPTPQETMVRWVADWVKNGGRSLGRPAHFEVRDGKF